MLVTKFYGLFSFEKESEDLPTLSSSSSSARHRLSRSRPPSPLLRDPREDIDLRLFLLRLQERGGQYSVLPGLTAGGGEEEGQDHGQAGGGVLVPVAVSTVFTT